MITKNKSTKENNKFVCVVCRDKLDIKDKCEGLGVCVECFPDNTLSGYDEDLQRIRDSVTYVDEFDEK